MKKMILTAILVLGAGVVASRADSYCGGTVAPGYAAANVVVTPGCSTAGAYVAPVRYPGYYPNGENYYYYRRSASDAHHDYHVALKEAHRAFDNRMKQEKYYGVPREVRSEERSVARRAFREDHHDAHVVLKSSRY